MEVTYGYNIVVSYGGTTFKFGVDAINLRAATDVARKYFTDTFKPIHTDWVITEVEELPQELGRSLNLALQPVEKED